jgi:hypothetical protein
LTEFAFDVSPPVKPIRQFIVTVENGIDESPMITSIRQVDVPQGCGTEAIPDFWRTG